MTISNSTVPFTKYFVVDGTQPQFEFSATIYNFPCSVSQIDVMEENKVSIHSDLVYERIGSQDFIRIKTSYSPYELLTQDFEFRIKM